MAVYGLGQTRDTPTRFPWNGEPLRRLVRKVRSSFAPIPRTNEYQGSFEQVWRYEYWFAALHGFDLPRSYR